LVNFHKPIKVLFLHPQILAQPVNLSKFLGWTPQPYFESQFFRFCIQVLMIICHFIYIPEIFLLVFLGEKKYLTYIFIFLTMPLIISY